MKKFVRHWIDFKAHLKQPYCFFNFERSEREASKDYVKELLTEEKVKKASRRLTQHFFS